MPHAAGPSLGPNRTWLRLGLVSVGLVSFGLAAGVPVAHADPARIGITAYLREGPGTNYRPVDEVSAGREADAVGCEAGWCRIRVGDLYGYVPQTALSAGPFSQAPATPTCFVNQQAGYHGTRDMQLCHASSGER